MKKGNKPDFHDAADAITARRVYDHFYNKMRESYKEDRVKNGVFQAMMDVELKNDGPVGVDYTSEDAVVTTYLVFLAPPSAPWNWRTNGDYRLRSKSIRISPRRNRRSPNRPKTRIKTRIVAVQARRLSLRFRRNCWHKK
jgi:hypothetical protein